MVCVCVLFSFFHTSSTQFTTEQHGNETDRPVAENRKEQVGKDQEKAQSEKDSHSKNRGGKKPN